MDTLDPRSIGITLSLSGVALTAVLWAARRDGDAIAGLNSWLLSSGALALGLALNAMQDILPDWIARVISNALMTGAVVCAWRGARQLRGIATSYSAVLLVAIFMATWSIVFTYLWPSTRIRIAGYSLTMAIACLFAGCEFLRQKQLHLRSAARFGGIPLLIFGLMMIARAIDAMTRAEITTAHTPTPVNIATYLLGSVVLLCCIASMVMSVNASRAATIRELAYRDVLTGALSRRGLYAALPQWMREHLPGATVAVLDANGFKQINDAMGHEMGDRVLQALVESCRMRLPESCLIARFGGDEFVLLLPPALNANDVLNEVAAQFRQSSVALLPSRSDLSPSVAVGHAPIPAIDVNAFAQALREADAVMYENKVRKRD